MLYALFFTGCVHSIVNDLLGRVVPGMAGRTCGEFRQRREALCMGVEIMSRALVEPKYRGPERVYFKGVGACGEGGGIGTKKSPL
jgi:hypothetical protein